MMLSVFRGILSDRNPKFNDWLAGLMDQAQVVKETSAMLSD